jgi:integrase
MRATTEKLTQRRIDVAQRGDRSRPKTLRDHDVRGLRVAVNELSISFIYEYKPRGIDPATGKRYGSRHRWLGDQSTLSLHEARELARDLRRRVQRGGDPKIEDAQAAAEAAAEEERRMTEATDAAAARIGCGDRLEAYTTVLAARGRSRRHTGNEVRQVRSALLAMAATELPPTEITRAMVETMLATCPPLSAAARLSALGRFLSWALKGTSNVSPTLLFDRHEKPRRPPARRRVLTGGELSAIWCAAGKLPSRVIGDLVRFCISVPCRRGEATVMRWAHVNIGARIWRLPTSKSGAHEFPLNDLALAILERRIGATGGHPDDLVFPGPRFGRACSWSDVIPDLAARIDPTTPVSPGWRLHDIRRSFCSLLADTGNFDETLLDLAIGHRGPRAGVLGVYQHAQRWAERVAALNAWDRLLSIHLADNVESMPMRRMG